MRIFLVILLGLILGGGAYAYFMPKPEPLPAEPETNTYMNNTHGISFTYPKGYVLKEGERGNAERGHYAIALVREEDTAPRENGEGPVGISIDIYENRLDKLSLVEWLNSNSASNFKLSDGTYASTTVAETEAVFYRWSGLYEADDTAFIHRDAIISAVVTYLTPEDESRAVYRDIIDSMQLF